MIPLGLTGCGGNVISSGGSGSGINSAPLAVKAGPQLGYAWVSSDQSLRPILGIAGSSLFGQSVVPAGTYALGAASVRSSIALLQSADGSLYAMSLPGGSPQRIGSGVFPLATQIVFSPNGQSALLLTPGAPTLTLITSVNSAPATQALTVPAALLSAAVSDSLSSGTQVAIVSGTGPYTVAMLTGAQSPIATLTGFGGLGFLTGTDSLLVADSATSAAAIFRNTATAPAAQALTSTALSDPIAVAASQDGHYALIANGSAAPSTLIRFDLTGGSAPITIACACQPSALDALNGNAVFRLTAAGTSTTWVVDASAATPRTVFIPAAVTR
jgi:hypothetical protein